ncbi:MAG TPA: glycosyltransferase family 4 protein [archaeon]|nr:glycosyltransferase family 4 protein [archaeon]
MAKLKVGIFTWDFEPIAGGIGIHASELYRAMLEDRNFEPMVFSPSETRLPGHITVKRILSGQFGQLIFSLQCALVCEKMIQKYSLDLVHFMGSSGGVQLLRRASKPAVYTLNNTYFYLNRKFPSIKFMFMKFLEKLSLRNSSFRTAISRGIVDEINSDYKCDLRVVYIGIDQKLFKPSGKPGANKAILYVGRLEERKGVMDLLEAFAHLKDKRLQLWFVGEGPAGEKIPQKAVAMGVEGNVKIFPKVPREKLPEFYSSATLSVLPSWSEGFGLTIAEAMSCGCAVIGSDIPGIRDQIDDGKNGFLCRPKDPADLAKKLRAALAMGNGLQKIRENAIIKSKNFTVSKMMSDYAKIYSMLVEK